MPFPVSLCRGEVNFEALPVAKITDYPLEKADYKPFAQCLLCAREDSFSLRMWAFEVYSSPQSELRCVMGLFQDPALAVHVRAAADSPVRVEAWVEGGGAPIPIEVRGRPYNGEDLQGVYWGAHIGIPYAALEAAAPMLPPLSGTSFPGNFYKLRTDEPYIHMGSYSPAHFPEAPFLPESMGLFTIVPY